MILLRLDDQRITQGLPAVSTETAAIYSDHVKAAHVIREVVLRYTAILNYINQF